MFSLVAGTFILALLHALIPNHWLPLVAVARAEGWKVKDVTTVTLISATAHVLGTVALGLVLGVIGKIAVIRHQTVGFQTIFRFHLAPTMQRQVSSIRHLGYIVPATRIISTGK